MQNSAHRYVSHFLDFFVSSSLAANQFTIFSQSSPYFISSNIYTDFLISR